MDKITDHAARALSRVLTQDREKPPLEGLLSEPGVRAQTLEDAAWDLLSRLGVDDSFGAQLDGIGRIVGEARAGANDEDYRPRLKARIRLNLSSGTVPDIVAIFQLLAAEPRTVAFVAQYPAAFVLRVFGSASADAAALTKILRAAAAAGVRAIFEYLNDTPENTFTLDTGPGLDVGVFGNARE